MPPHYPIPGRSQGPFKGIYKGSFTGYYKGSLKGIFFGVSGLLDRKPRQGLYDPSGLLELRLCSVVRLTWEASEFRLATLVVVVAVAVVYSGLTLAGFIGFRNCSAPVRAWKC